MKLRKKVITVVLTGGLLFQTAIPSITALAASTDVCSIYANVVLDGKKQKFDDQQPIIEAGTVYVPIRFISEEVGASVKYTHASGAVTIRKGDNLAQFTIGSKKAFINNKEVTLPKSVFTLNGRTMVPLRYVGEALGILVKWDQTNRTVWMLNEGETNSIIYNNNAVTYYLNNDEVKQLRNEIEVYKQNVEDFEGALKRIHKITGQNSHLKKVLSKVKIALNVPYYWNIKGLNKADKGHGVKVTVYYDAITIFESQTLD